jgi:hypothetical protein
VCRYDEHCDDVCESFEGNGEFQSCIDNPDYPVPLTHQLEQPEHLREPDYPIDFSDTAHPSKAVGPPIASHQVQRNN